MCYALVINAASDSCVEPIHVTVSAVESVKPTIDEIIAGLRQSPLADLDDGGEWFASTCDACLQWDAVDGSLIGWPDKHGALFELPDPRDRWPLLHGSSAVLACPRCLGWTLAWWPEPLRHDDVLDALRNANAVHEDDHASVPRLRGCYSDLREVDL